MARYRLTKQHYLKTDPPTEWEQREQSQQTGKEARYRVEVPMLIEEGQTICTNEKDAFPGQMGLNGVWAIPPDVVVVMDYPSNEMEPLDREAEAALAKMEAVWAGKANPVESLPSKVDMSALGAVAAAKAKPSPRIGRRL